MISAHIIFKFLHIYLHILPMSTYSIMSLIIRLWSEDVRMDNKILYTKIQIIK